MTTLVKEIWRNVTQGLRYYIALDPIGNQTHKSVQPGRTFTISPMERRLNQEAAWAEKADMFKNGTFVLEQESPETLSEEVESANALTDKQIEEAVALAGKGKTEAIETILTDLDSLVTAERILDELVSQDARQSLINAAKNKVEILTERPIGPDGKPMRVAQRETVQSPEWSEDEPFRQSRGQHPR